MHLDGVRLDRIICLGDVMVDVLARLPGPLAAGSDTPAPIALLGGGSAANTAAWLAAVGAPVTLVARVGDDALGRAAMDELIRAGVELAVSVDRFRPTGMCIVLVDPSGERTMVPSAGANEGRVTADIRTRQHLHVSGYSLLRPTTSHAIARIVAQGRAVGGSVSVDAASAAPLRDFGPDRFLDQIGTVLLFANADEAAVLTGLGDPGASARQLGGRCGQAIVKCGPDGAVWSDGAAIIEAPAEPISPVDSTGAGDAFAAGVLAALGREPDISAALRAGQQLAAQAIVRRGARPTPP